MKDLKQFLEGNQEEEDRACFDVADPPCKRFRHGHTEEGADDLNQNGVLSQIPLANDGNADVENSDVENSAVEVCNVCLGILQEFCEIDFVKKVNNQFLIYTCTFFRSFCMLWPAVWIWCLETLFS